MGEATVFVSYSHGERDEKVLDRLEVFLKPLEREGLIFGWTDRRIAGGRRWHDEIENVLQRARVVEEAPDLIYRRWPASPPAQPASACCAWASPVPSRAGAGPWAQTPGSCSAPSPVSPSPGSPVWASASPPWTTPPSPTTRLYSTARSFRAW